MSKDNNKDISNSLNKYTNYTGKGTNLILGSVENINKWYAEQLNKITKSDIEICRIETGVDNIGHYNNGREQKEILTKIKQYNEIQTSRANKRNLMWENKIYTIKENNKKSTESVDNIENTIARTKTKSNISKRISSIMKEAKMINNISQKIIGIGRNINTGLSENDITTFKTVSNRIMTKPIQKVASNISKKTTKKTVQYTKKITKKISKSISNKFSKKVISQSTNAIVKLLRLIAKLIVNSIKLTSSILTQIAPIIIIIIIIAIIGDFLNFKNIKESENVNFDEISKMMIVIEDEKLQAIYNEFLKNMGTPYLMDHSNLKYDECMDYYDCSSWVIHCLAHTGIKTIPNAGAQGIYMNYCYSIAVHERKAGDLIFLKNTYGNFKTEGVDSITHVGIYMGELTINGETAEWVIDTGENPTGVRIRRYDNGWWNGENFYGFARLKE